MDKCNHWMCEKHDECQLIEFIIVFGDRAISEYDQELKEESFDRTMGHAVEEPIGILNTNNYG